MDTGAIVAVTVQDASDGDTATLPETLIMAAEQVEAVQPNGVGVEEVVADKGYHSDATLVAYCGRCGSPISAEVDHLFRSKWITDFGGSGSLSAELDHPVSGIVSAHR